MLLLLIYNIYFLLLFLDLFTGRAPGKRKADYQHQTHGFKKRKVDHTKQKEDHRTNNENIRGGKKFSPFKKQRNSKFESNANKPQKFRRDKKFDKRRRNDTSNFKNRDSRPIGKQHRK